MNLQGTPFDFVIAFSAGFLVSFTPCVYPLLPVTAAVVGGANVRGTKLNGFFLSVVYVLGMAVTYSVFALVAALTGKVFGVLQNNVLFQVGAGLMLLFFALVMFDLVPFPVFAAPVAGKKPRGALALFVMGLVSGIMIGPCTAPILGTLLLYIGSKQNLWMGASLLFVFALGMGTTLIAVGTFSGLLARLPRSGAWMIGVKRGTGFVLVCIALFMFLKAGGFL